MNESVEAPPGCCDHAEDARRWWRVERLIARAITKGYDLDPQDLIDAAYE